MAGKSATKERQEMIPQSWVKQRGWSDRLIKDLLGEPDEYAVNRFYKSGPPMRLFLLSRVETAEHSEAYLKSRKAGEKRREAAKKAVETKRKKTRDYLDTVVIKVPQVEKDELLRQACDHWMQLQYDREDFFAECDPKTSSPEFLHRITVNYLRHQLTRYERHLVDIYGLVGARDAYLEIKTKVLSEIAETYYWLAAECQRQIDVLLAPPEEYPY